MTAAEARNRWAAAQNTMDSLARQLDALPANPDLAVVEDIERQLNIAQAEADTAHAAMGPGLRVDQRHATGDRHVSDGSLRSRALAANERAAFLPEPAREHMERSLRDDTDPDNRLARFTIATSDRNYFRAFTQWANDPIGGPHGWTPEERDAYRRVQSETRGMTIGTPGGGGFMLPYELDPNIVIAGVGVVNPMRQVSRVVSTAFNTKKFVTSLGVSTAWYAEEAEVADNTPALLQPSIDCKKAMSFVPASFEFFEDSDIAQQIGALFADAKVAEESRVFTTGSGTTEPKGIITALVAAGGSTVIATASNVYAQADLYTNQAALPPRWRPGSKFMMNLSVINGYRQLPQATGLNYSVVDDSGPTPRALGWQVVENSAMDGVLTGGAADYDVLSGDFRQFAIVDRVGTSIELVQNLFGATRRPTGQRGFLMHWRTGSDVLVPDAFRLTNHST
jgi:HK97 family phage major capsid protein